MEPGANLRAELSDASITTTKDIDEGPLVREKVPASYHHQATGPHITIDTTLLRACKSKGILIDASAPSHSTAIDIYNMTHSTFSPLAAMPPFSRRKPINPHCPGPASASDGLPGPPVPRSEQRDPRCACVGLP